MTSAQLELQSIQAMLAAGHRSVQLERHSLLLIGGVGGAVTGFTEFIITSQRFPDLTQRAVALLVWLSAWLGGMCIVDHALTRRARAHRDETLPFAQAQITRAWWMLLAMGTLGSFAMFFYGGAAMIYTLWIVLVGLGIYLFGLFSRPLVESIGMATLLLGVVGAAAGLRYEVTHWLAASCFAIGMPLAGWLDRRCVDAALPRRAVALVAWIVLVAGPPLVLTRLAWVTPPAVEPLRPGAAALLTGEQILRLDAGTSIGLRLDMEGPVMQAVPGGTLALTLSVPVEVVLRDGAPDGRYRIAEGDWHEVHDGVVDLAIDRLTPRLENGVPVVQAHALFGAHLLKRIPR